MQKIKGEILSNKTNVSTKKNINNIDVSKNETENEDQYLQRLINNRVSRVTGVISLDRSKYLKDFILSKELLTLVSSYINTKTLSINVSYFISLPVNISEKENLKMRNIFIGIMISENFLSYTFI